MAGEFVWYELMTTDPAAAAKFYGDVIGWTERDAQMPGWDYRLMSAGKTEVAGIMPMVPDAEGAGPFWFSYIGVADVDAAAGTLKAKGGQIHKEPDNIPGVGRFAVAADPQGAAFMIFTPTGSAPESPHPMTPGHVGWHELHTSDGEAGWQFYSAEFGWHEHETMDMGEMGLYRMFRPDAAAEADGAVGGIFTSSEAPAPMWLLYFSVPDIDEGIARIKAAGGTITVEKMEVPGGAWIINATDPQGAPFALVAPPNS